MIDGLRHLLTRNLMNAPGWRTDRKILIIESDDWGSVRVSGKAAYKSLLNSGIRVDKCPYNSFDALESNTDLEQLMDTLDSVRDINGNPCVMTMNNIVGNPNFEKIQESGYQTYHYEKFTETLKRYPEHEKVIDLYRQGIRLGLFKPQFHGREHVNIDYWLDDLRKGRKETLLAFKEQMFSTRMETTPVVKNEYMDHLNFNSLDMLPKQEESLLSGLDLFEDIWGYRSESFIAPAYIWHPQLEPTLAANGVKFIQGIVNQLIPTEKSDYVFQKKYHYTGQQNKSGQRYLIRNVFFEPVFFQNTDNVQNALKRIDISFKWGKPAIISSHRLNFIGWINNSNRRDNLIALRKLLKAIVKKWPDVEFMSSDTLGALILKDKIK